MTIDEFKTRIERAWCLETCYSGDRASWSIDRPSTGQCTVTAMLFYDYFGGQIIRGKNLEYNIIHYWNRVDGEEIDLTFQQFLPEKRNIVFSSTRIVDKSILMRISSVRKRYDLLKRRFEDPRNNLR